MNKTLLGLGAAGLALTALLAVPASPRPGAASAVAPADTIPVPETVLSWANNAIGYRGHDGRKLTFTCPAEGDLEPIWGTDVYTDDSSICTAAVHAGAITRADGGTITIEIRPGQASYFATNRNGLESKPYGSWGGSFAIVR